MNDASSTAQMAFTIVTIVRCGREARGSYRPASKVKRVVSLP
jgi:hypothetical protein